MDGFYNISSVCASVLKMLDIPVPPDIEPGNSEIAEICPHADRVVLYNPDAVAWWLYAKYPRFFEPAEGRSDLTSRITSVMPSVTPVCFASMYTGLQPEKHGIMKYEKPVLTADTLFDYLIKAGKKPAIVSTAGDSISKIFLKRNMDYFIFPTKGRVNRMAEKLIAEGKHDLIVIYNPDYDSVMHATGPESRASLRHLRQNIATYEKFVNLIRKTAGGKKIFYGFCPDHGCHQTDKGRGSHGLDMYEDMNVIHFYGVTD